MLSLVSRVPLYIKIIQKNKTKQKKRLHMESKDRKHGGVCTLFITTLRRQRQADF